MAQLEELQSRIASAMDRIAQGAEALASKPPEVDLAEVTRLTAALDEEKLTNAQLEERLRTLRDKNLAEVASFKAQLDSTSAAMMRLDADVQRLRFANEQLANSNEALRKANAEGVGDAHLINKALLIELEGMRASRAADRSETAAILAKLAPLLDASETEEEADA